MIVYVLPESSVSYYASRVNNLTVEIFNGSRILCKKLQAVNSVTLDFGLQSFLTFLKEQQNVHTGDGFTTLANCLQLADPSMFACAGCFSVKYNNVCFTWVINYGLLDWTFCLTGLFCGGTDFSKFSS